ncbi:MAG: hypothetical protein ACJAU1_001347 [Psychromonas sp.]|jgi:hypothetical protein
MIRSVMKEYHQGLNAILIKYTEKLAKNLFSNNKLSNEQRTKCLVKLSHLMDMPMD